MTRPPTIMQIASSTIDHANDGRNEEHAWTSKRRPEIQVVKLHCLRSNRHRIFLLSCCPGRGAGSALFVLREPEYKRTGSFCLLQVCRNTFLESSHFRQAQHTKHLYIVGVSSNRCKYVEIKHGKGH